MMDQIALPLSPSLARETADFLRRLVGEPKRPSGHEVVKLLEKEVGPEARWDLIGAIEKLSDDKSLSFEARDYLTSLLRGEDVAAALRGEDSPRRDVLSTVDELLAQTSVYQSSKAFREMIDFMGRFREYSPYNNMLVRTQNPSCSYFATARDWFSKFARTLKEDARPMIILAPMHPVLLVYDLDQTEGAALPEHIKNFARFQNEGDWDTKQLTRLTANAKRYKIRVAFNPLSSTHGGFATLQAPIAPWKRRIVVHKGLDKPSRFGVLCHELAHVLLGHLGGDPDGWWPPRAGIDRATAEIEAESTAAIVTSRLGLSGSSASYLSTYVQGGRVPNTVSLDWIAKVAGLIERMSLSLLPPPKRKPPKKAKGK